MRQDNLTSTHRQRQGDGQEPYSTPPSPAHLHTTLLSRIINDPFIVMIHSLQPPGKNERESCATRLPACQPIQRWPASRNYWASQVCSILTTENSNAFSPHSQLLASPPRSPHIVYTGGSSCLSHLSPQAWQPNIPNILIQIIVASHHTSSPFTVATREVVGGHIAQRQFGLYRE